MNSKEGDFTMFHKSRRSERHGRHSEKHTHVCSLCTSVYTEDTQRDIHMSVLCAPLCTQKTLRGTYTRLFSVHLRVHGRYSERHIHINKLK